METAKRDQIREEMRELAKVAHKRESGDELNSLKEKFQEWKNAELEGIIKDTHDIIHRNIWKAHDFDDDFIVIRAVYKNIIKREELSNDLYDYLKDKIERLKNVLENGF